MELGFLKYLRIKVKDVDPKGIDLNLVQVSNISRLENNPVIFNFDEVGCGKTLSAIMCILSLIAKKRPVNILILAPSKLISGNIYREFCSKVYWKALEKDFSLKLHHITDGCLDCSSLSNEENEENEKSHLIITHMNHNVFGRLMNYDRDKLTFDLIVMDEADRLICNTKAQNELDDSSDGMIPARFSHTIRRNEKGERIFEEGTKKYHLLAKLRAKKLMFMTASPIRYHLEYDTRNYEYMALSMLRESYNDPENPMEMDALREQCAIEKLKELDIVNDVFSQRGLIHNLYGQEDEENSENLSEQYYEGNTSLCFKEMAWNLLIGKEASTPRTSHERIPHLLDYSTIDTKESFYQNFADVLKQFIQEPKNATVPNRFVVFVKYLREAEELLNALGINTVGADVSKMQTTDDGIKVHVIFGLLKNTQVLLEQYSTPDDPENCLPDILILSEAIGNVGINLPAYNNIVNLHISAAPSDLEQRFGRIDRYNSKHHALYCDYVYCPKVFYTYANNLLYAVKAYLETEVEHIPTKNVLINKEIIGVILSDSSKEAFREAIEQGHNLNDARERFAGAIVDEITKNNSKSGKDTRGADGFNFQAILDGIVADGHNIDGKSYDIPENLKKLLKNEKENAERDALVEAVRKKIYADDEQKNKDREDTVDDAEDGKFERIDTLKGTFERYRKCLTIDKEGIYEDVEALICAIGKAYGDGEKFSKAGTIVYRDMNGDTITADIDKVIKRCRNGRNGLYSVPIGKQPTPEMLSAREISACEKSHIEGRVCDLCYELLHEKRDSNKDSNKENLLLEVTKKLASNDQGKTKKQKENLTNEYNEYKEKYRDIFSDGYFLPIEEGQPKRLSDQGYLKLLLECVCANINGHKLQWNEKTIVPAVGTGKTYVMQYKEDGTIFDSEIDPYIHFSKLHADIHKTDSEKYLYLYFLDDVFGSCSEEDQKLIKQLYEEYWKDKENHILLTASEFFPESIVQAVAQKDSSKEDETLRNFIKYFTTAKLQKDGLYIDEAVKSRLPVEFFRVVKRSFFKTPASHIPAAFNEQYHTRYNKEFCEDFCENYSKDFKETLWKDYFEVYRPQILNNLKANREYLSHHLCIALSQWIASMIGKDILEDVKNKTLKTFFERTFYQFSEFSECVGELVEISDEVIQSHKGKLIKKDLIEEGKFELANSGYIFNFSDPQGKKVITPFLSGAVDKYFNWLSGLFNHEFFEEFFEEFSKKSIADYEKVIEEQEKEQEKTGNRCRFADSCYYSRDYKDYFNPLWLKWLREEGYLLDIPRPVTESARSRDTAAHSCGQ